MNPVPKHLRDYFVWEKGLNKCNKLRWVHNRLWRPRYTRLSYKKQDHDRHMGEEHMGKTE